MAGIMNGMALHKGVIPYGGTFLVFTDYCRPSIRLAAIMKLHVIFVMTHDSIGLGEDGPTHQPIEHLASLRAIPNINIYRPADIIETIEAWESALINKNNPSVLVLTRQNLPIVRKNNLRKLVKGLNSNEFSFDQETLKKHCIDWRGEFSGDSDLILFPFLSIIPSL